MKLNKDSVYRIVDYSASCERQLDDDLLLALAAAADVDPAAVLEQHCLLVEKYSGGAQQPGISVDRQPARLYEE